MKRSFLTLATAALLALTASAQEGRSLSAAPAPPPAKKPAVLAPAGLGLKDGDRFIFIGDSITHACLYTQYVENYFYTRYPGMRLHFRNAGVSGDRAQDVLNRFDEDIASFKPTVATVLLGMNDGGYKDFDKATFDTYAKGMNELLDKLKAINCRVIVMSPTMFDHQAWDVRIKEKPEYAKGRVVTGYNAVLAYYGKWLQETAWQRNLQFVDLFGPLNTFTVQQRRIDPAFTLIQDAIHPGPDGNFIMAYSLVKQTGEAGPILSAGVRLVGGQWQPLNPNVVTEVKGNPGRSVSYTVKPKALPWVQQSEAPLGVKLTRAGHTASQESHIASGLISGRYDLHINGKFVGTWDEHALSVHAEIEEDPDSPTYQQALKIVALNKKRNDEAVRPLRGLWGKQKGMFAKREAEKAAYDTWQVEFVAKRKELDDLAAKYEADIYQANQVQPLKVQIAPTPRPAAVKEGQPVAKPAEPKKAA
ncbi:MAG TPA: SGNH/GDSL hydrolase family protein [Candidatus Saccharimonadia bacterium]|nr:SGNH/GDSL hydrolase family protein [Candidatus Saccharimonadia bacterium]